MGRDISIAISAKDNFTQAITTMRNANSSFNKDLTGLSDKLDALNKNKISLKVDTDKAKVQLKEAEKQFSATGSAADKMALEIASANYDNSKRNLELVSKNAKQAEKDILSMTDAVSKADNRAGSGKNSDVGLADTMNKLAGAGLTKMMGDSLSGAAKTLFSSAVNDETGSAVSSILGGVTTGAAMGSVIPGFGAAVGAAVGGIAGTINAASSYFQKQDDAFKSVVQDSYNNIISNESSGLASGITSASTKEGDLRAFTTLLGGSTTKAQELQKSLVEVGRTKLSYDTVASLSKEMLGLGESTTNVKKKINDLNEAAAAHDWSDSTVSSITALMDSSVEAGTFNLRTLRTFAKNGVDAGKAISEAFHIKESDVPDKIGKLDAQSVANALYNYMGHNSQMAGSVAKYQSSYEGIKKRAESYESSLNTAEGTGHNAEAKKGYQNEINTLSGSTGSALKEAYTMEGKFKASLENAQKQLLMNAYTSVTSGTVTGKFDDDNATNEKIKKELQGLAADYKTEMAKANAGDQEAELQAARDIEKAKIIAQNAYKASEGYQLQIKSDLDLAASIRDNSALNTEYYDTGYKMGQEFSTGLAKGVLENRFKFEPSQTLASSYLQENSTGVQSKTQESSGGKGSSYLMRQATGKSNATGIFRVPYNGYPAILHEGETVNTAVEARSAKNIPSVTITGNSFVVREEADVDKVVRAIVEEIYKVAAVS